MMKNLILIISTLFIILTSFQSAIGQNSSTLKGKVTDYNTNEYLPGVKIEIYYGKILLNKTDTNLEDGSFTLSTKNTTDKIMFSCLYYYPIIIENINKVEENEFFKDKRIQVSIFLSPLDVHVNRYPVSGEIVYSKYHTGDYLVAWHPKSSLKNERTTVVINNKKFGEVLYRQIAGAVARRIVNYATTNTHIVQGEDSGFIKFGSRVDFFLPLESDIKVKVGDRVSGGMSVIV